MATESKVMLVTGASRGIGAAIALLAAQRGYAVCVNYHQSREPALAVVQAIRGQGGEAIAVQADASREDQIMALFNRVHETYGRLDALVNNAGVVDVQSKVEQMSAARISRMFTTNVLGPFLCCREAVRRMSPRHGGRGGAIVNMSSIAAILGSPNDYVDYAASKGAVDTLTLGLAKEVAGDGIRVNAVRPGMIYTDIHASFGEPGRVDRIKDTIPMKRGGMPEEIAAAVLWLCSDEASYTTGTLVNVSGGRL